MVIHAASPRGGLGDHSDSNGTPAVIQRPITTRRDLVRLIAEARAGRSAEPGIFELFRYEPERGLKRVATAGSIPHAIARWARLLRQLFGVRPKGPVDFTAVHGEPRRVPALGPDDEELRPAVEALDDDGLLVALQGLSVLGLFEFDAETAESSYLETAPRGLPARLVVGLSAAPPYHDDAMTLIERPLPTEEPKDEPLFRAALAGDAGAIREAARHGASVHAVRAPGATPLHCAVASRKPVAVAALLELGAAPGALQDFGASALFAREERKGVLPSARRIESRAHLDALLTLIRAGADPNARSVAGTDLITLASHAGARASHHVAELRALGAKVMSRGSRSLQEHPAFRDLHEASLKQNLALIEALLEGRDDLNSAGERMYSDTLLQSCVRRLLRERPHPESPEANVWPAELPQFERLCRLLLDHGAADPFRGKQAPLSVVIRIHIWKREILALVRIAELLEASHDAETRARVLAELAEIERFFEQPQATASRPYVRGG